MIFNRSHNQHSEQLEQLIYFKKNDADTRMNIEMVAEGGHMLLNGMQNRLTEIETQIASEKNKEKLGDLTLRKDRLTTTLKHRNSPINNPESLKDAIDSIEYDQFLLERLDVKSFDQIDLRFLMDSDIMPFFDEASQGQMAVAFEQMNTSDFVHNTMNPGAGHLEAPTGKGRRIVGLPSVMQAAKPDTLEKIRLNLQEAQYIRTERILEYLSQQFSKLQNNVSNSEKRGLFEKSTSKALEQELAEAKRLLLNKTGGSPDMLARIGDNIESAIITFGLSEKEVQEAKGNRPQIEEQVKRDYSKLHQVLTNLNPDQLQAVIDKYKAQQMAKGTKADSAIVRKAVNALEELKNPDSQLHNRAVEFEQRIETISDLSLEELLLAKQDLDALIPKLDLLENLEANMAEIQSPENEIASKSHEIIKSIMEAKSADKVKELLEKTLGAEHLETVSKASFEQNYKQFTESGHMVFEEKGNTWKIIIDESAFTEMPLMKLKKLIRHELLHLEFEKAKGVKDSIRTEIVEGQPEEWAKIKAAYLQMAKDTKKSPPHGDTWEDDDILSELYAMQNDIGQFYTKDKTSTDTLNNLLVNIGIGKALGSIAEKTREFNEGAKVKVRGAQEGVERGEEGSAHPNSEEQVEGTDIDRAVFERNKKKIDELSERIAELRKSKYLQYVKRAAPLLAAMNDFNDSTGRLNDILSNEPNNQVISVTVNERNAKVSAELTKVEGTIGKAARKAPNDEIGFFRKAWLNTTFLSFADIGQMGMDTIEFLERRHKRRKADHAAQLGKALFGGTDIGRDASAKQQKAEAEEVQEWQSRYENLDAWQLLAAMADLASSLDPSKDQLKAIVRILSKKGRLNWLDDNLWICLNRLQGSVELKPGDPMLYHNPVLLRQKMHKAMGEIWDYDEYTTLLRQNESAYEGEKAKYNSEHDRSPDTLGDKLNDLVARHRAGENVDPMEFESIIEYCITKGKSFAENALFHLLTGMAVGILAPDRGLSLGSKHINLWPPLEWINTLRPPYSTADFDRLCRNAFGKSYEIGNITDEGGRDFKNWFWTVVQNDKSVIERVQKSVGERAWDHDWSRSIACLGSAQTAKQFLSGRSGQQETKHTAVGNAYVGAVQWLEENAINPQFADKKKFAKMAAWISMTEGILNGTCYNQKERDINTRQDEAMNSGVPREAGIGRHGSDNLRTHRDITQQFLYLVDPTFFSTLRDKEARENDQKEELGQWAAQHLAAKYPSLAKEMEKVTSIDQIYDRLDLIVNTMFESMSEEYFRYLLGQLASGAS